MKDVACCCNMSKIHQFYMSMMALRRNPQRQCKKEELPVLISTNSAPIAEVDEKPKAGRHATPKVPRSLQLITRHQAHASTLEPFRFFGLPREVRDHVYSYLVVRRGRTTPVIEAKTILRSQKKRATAERTRVRLNQKRAQSGRRPIAPREPSTEPVLHLNVLQASRALQFEASDYMYENNWFAISLDNIPVTTIDTPLGWDYSRITKMQLELQLKDAQRMNSYIDWGTFFAGFRALRSLRIIPTFHPRYYDWAQVELNDWNTAHFIFRAFFRELLASVPERISLKLGPSLKPNDDMQLEGRVAVGAGLLRQMYVELGTRRSIDVNGGWFGGVLKVERVVDCGEMVERMEHSLAM
ncbi:hypothetical protein K505DRAFT_230794 [Melanomma pulvis-pyrius CBS 109.77]|uniref:F-box domain-containing protein n=1 Tax=Melanomma pulvis-pyrius CBS 109.77 TaxID=1314802 RepID=A0A6A6XTK3_9PLEO|nr:hypothetical protein K505DRAFT_230794 [Melanomma pulvis-pyrius CBS 109.77]